MADLRSGSTVGNSLIVNMKMLNQFLPSEKMSDWNNKMNRYENGFYSSEGFDTIFNNKDKNGLYEFNNATPNSSIYNYGSLFSLNSGNYGLQLLAPEKENGSSAIPALYFRTRLQGTNRAWNRIATYDYVSSVANTRLPLTGGTMKGILSSTADFRTTARAFINIKNKSQDLTTPPAISLAIGDHDTGFNWIQDGQFHFFADSVAVAKVTPSGMDMIKGLTMCGKQVWNAGNFNPNEKIDKSIQLSEKSDLNNTTAEGHYRVLHAINLPSTITGWAYLEVITHTSAWVLQKVYNYEGTLAYYRTKSNGTWQRWIPMGNIWNKAVQLTVNSWVQDTTSGSATYGMYYCKINHNASSNNVVAVSFIDSGNSSVEISYDINDVNNITIWVNEKTAGIVRMLGYV